MLGGVSGWQDGGCMGVIECMDGYVCALMVCGASGEA